MPLESHDSNPAIYFLAQLGEMIQFDEHIACSFVGSTTKP